MNLEQAKPRVTLGRKVTDLYHLVLKMAELPIAINLEDFTMLSKKILAITCATALMGAASMANAATYTIDGGGTTVTLAPAFGGLFPTGTVAATQTVAGSGTVDDTGGVFNSAMFTTTVVVTSPLDALLLQTIVTSYDITDILGNGTTTVDSCTEQVGGTSCGDFTIGLASAINPASFGFDFSDLSNITWATSSDSFSAALGVNLNTTINYAAAPSAVPVPAAAWLFGSALLSLAGVSRRRRG
jgi:hypothetical protein